jgi:hypothetical protein
MVAVKKTHTLQMAALPSISDALNSNEFRKAIQAAGEVQKRLAESMVKTLAIIRENAPKFKAHLPEQLRILAEHGWFIQGDATPLAAIYPLAAIFRAGKVNEANLQMCSHIQSCADGIEKSLIADFPKRAAILKRAFDALRARDYMVSIPMMLAQADGIGREIIAPHERRFSITSRRPDLQKPIRDFISKTAAEAPYTGEIFEAILRDSQLNVSEGHRLQTADSLNRNAVLHGQDTEYATELNALKAVAWIGYVSYFGDIKQLRRVA